VATVARKVIPGTDGVDDIVGTADADEIATGKGNDIVHAGGGDDVVDGGIGDDILYGEGGNDRLYATVGNDRLYGGEGNDTLEGSLEAFANADFASLGLPANGRQTSYLYGEAGNDTLIAEATFGTAQTGTRTTYMYGGTGDDTYYVRFADQNYIFENPGEGTRDTIILLYRETPGSGNVFYMPANVEWLRGVLGTRTVNGVRESATIVGNNLDNYIETSAELGGVKTPTGNMTILAGAGNDSVFSDAGNDVLYGEAGDDSLSGGTGVDVLIGGEGNDSLDTSFFASDPTFADALYGGTGNDTYGIDHAGDIAFENAGEGTDTALVRIANGGWYAHAHIENIWSSSNTLTFLVGNAQDNDIRGGEASELLLGGGGNDSINGGLGNDSLFGEAGNDFLFGDGGIDYLAGGTGNDSLNGAGEADALYGEDGDDFLFGGTGFFTDILVGGAGNDSLDGGTGDRNASLGDYDLMDGGAGDDKYYVDTPDDLTFEAVGGGNDTVYAHINGAGYYLYANVENLYLSGNTSFGVGNELDNLISAEGNTAVTLLGGRGNDKLYGNNGANGLYGEDGNDELYGGGGNDVLIGGAGNDFLDGGAGGDVLVGGAGADRFFIGTHGNDIDYIRDFERGIDRIQLSASYIDFASLQSHFSQQGANTVIEYSSGRFLVLENVVATTLTGADFGF